ncbi:hypothetical protein INO08_15125, partial [Staphylococcus aureus]|nr:hypothetical protein [Staphylococcus aureus]
GALRYPEKVLPVLTLGLHRLSCVAQNPPPVANRVAELLLQLAYEHRFEGLTFGGVNDLSSAGLNAALAYGVPELERPPDDLSAYGDATWSAGINADEQQPPYLASL